MTMKQKEKVDNALTRTFEISHDDIRYALYNLLSSYEEVDNEWYYITGVYDSYLYMKVGMAVKFTVRNIQKTMIQLHMMERDIHYIKHILRILNMQNFESNAF